MMQKRLGWRFNQRLSIPDWIEHRYDGLRYARKVLVTRPQNLIGFWPQWEGNGVISFDNSPQGNNGLYTGVTLAQPGIGDGRYSAFFDGVNDFNNIHSAGLNADFDGDEGTLLAWAQVANVGVWTDGVIRYVVSLQADANNRIGVGKSNGGNDLFFRYEAGGTDEVITKVPVTTTGWMFLGVTWSASDDAVKYYFNGVQEGATHNGLGTWVGNLSNTLTVIGAVNTAPANVWSGNIGPVALLNAALTPAEMLFLGTLG